MDGDRLAVDAELGEVLPLAPADAGERGRTENDGGDEADQGPRGVVRRGRVDVEPEHVVLVGLELVAAAGGGGLDVTVDASHVRAALSVDFADADEENAITYVREHGGKAAQFLPGTVWVQLRYHDEAHGGIVDVAATGGGPDGGPQDLEDGADAVDDGGGDLAVFDCAGDCLEGEVVVVAFEGDGWVLRAGVTVRTL